MRLHLLIARDMIQAWHFLAAHTAGNSLAFSVSFSRCYFARQVQRNKWTGNVEIVTKSPLVLEIISARELAMRIEEYYIINYWVPNYYTD